MRDGKGISLVQFVQCPFFMEQEETQGQQRGSVEIKIKKIKITTPAKVKSKSGQARGQF